MDTQFTPETNAKKKPFAFASITLLFTAFLFFGNAFVPYLNALTGHITISQLLQAYTLSNLFYGAIIFCILCTAVAAFFKKSNIFLIISLFALAICLAIPAATSAYSGIQTSASVNMPLELRSKLVTAQILDSVRMGMFSLGFLVIGMVAIFARMGKTKAVNLWWLAAAFFAIAIIAALIYAVINIKANYEHTVQQIKMFLDGWYSFIEVFSAFLISYCAPALFIGTSVMNLINAILLGTYLKKLSK